MSKQIDEYNKKNWLPVIVRLKPDEKQWLENVLKRRKLSRRKFILEVLERGEEK